MQDTITVETDIQAPIDLVWDAYTAPEHIMEWNHASEDWHCPEAENDLEPGGAFCYTMAAKDGSQSFDLNGTFDEIVPGRLLTFTLDDSRHVRVTFDREGDSVHVTVEFEMEHENSEELQREGWQAILDNFKKHAESLM